MKIASYKIEQFLNKPQDGFSVLLIYGPDFGRVYLSAQKVVRVLQVGNNDPFNLRTVSPEQCASDSSVLAKEAGNLSLGGSRVIVRLAQASDRHTKAVQHLLSERHVSGIVVIEAGALTPRSSLRRLAEKEEKIAAIACYADRHQDLLELVRMRLKAAGLQIENEALMLFVQRLGADRAITENEIKKLILYMDEGARISSEDVLAATGDMAAMGLDDLADWTGLGDIVRLLRIFDRLSLTGLSPIVMLNHQSYHFQRLRLVLSAKSNYTQALQRLTPPIHFTRKDRFERQCQIWNLKAAGKALEILWKANIAQRSAQPSATSSHAMIAIARYARYLSKR